MSTAPKNLFHFFQTVDINTFQQQQQQLQQQSSIIIVQQQEEQIKEHIQQQLNKKGPGRPKKQKTVHLHDTTTPLTSPDDSTPSTRPHIDWFSSPLIHEIIHYARSLRSARDVVQVLQKKYPRLDTEQQGRYDSLRESTVRYWFNDSWQLKDQFKQLITGNEKTHYGGKKPLLDSYPELDTAIQTRLHQMRDNSCTMSLNIITMVIKGVIKKHHPDLLEQLKISQTFAHKYVKQKLNWSSRRATTACRLPNDWKELGITFAKRIAVRVNMINSTTATRNSFHKSLLLNIDQTGIELVPSTNYTYSEKGSKSVAMIGQDDKRQITCVLGSSADGDLLPLQLIFTGTTNRCHPSIPSYVQTDNFHITHSDNHWSNQATMKEYIEQIIQPYLQQKIAQHNLPKESKAILILDCWSVHKSEEFRTYMKQKHQNIYLVYVPPNCTSKLQVADVMLQYPFKHAVKSRFNLWAANIIEEQINSENEEVGLRNQLKMSVLKPLLLQWCYESWKRMSEQRLYIQSAWHNSIYFLLNPFDIDVQLNAVKDAVEQTLNIDYYFPDAKEKEPEDTWDEQSSDEEKDELDIMKEIHHGTRRSTRKRKQPQTLHEHMRVDPTALVITPFKAKK